MSLSDSNIRQVKLQWAGEGLVFRGGPEGGPEVTVDSNAEEGLTPTQLLLAALGGCMAVDVRMILEKSRVPLEALEVEVIGERAETIPKRFVRIDLVFRLRGPESEHEPRLRRAIELSRDKYCSILHTLNPDIQFDLRVERA